MRSLYLGYQFMKIFRISMARITHVLPVVFVVNVILVVIMEARIPWTITIFLRQKGWEQRLKHAAKFVHLNHLTAVIPSLMSSTIPKKRDNRLKHKIHLSFHPKPLLLIDLFFRLEPLARPISY